eukprot:4394056-Amphidinium_carterae.1
MAGSPSLCRIIRLCPSDVSQSTNLSTAKVDEPFLVNGMPNTLRVDESDADKKVTGPSALCAPLRKPKSSPISGNS